MNSLETAVLELIGEADDPDVFTDDDTGIAPIRDSLNDAIEEIAMVTGGHKRKFYLPMEGDIAFYRLTQTRDNIAWVTDVWLPNIKRRLEQKDLQWLLMRNPRWQQENGNPVRYGQIGKDVIWIHPVPSSSTYVLEITAVVVPERYTTETARVKLRDEFKWAAVHYAVSEYWAGRGDAKTAKLHHGEYLNKLGIQALYQEAPERVWTAKTEGA